ncbi:MAG TPA: FAD-dependent oxidoreductase [Nitrosospira sp.]|nr:FAD-dependent oxidoreductase [Nitrosospira sp.]
MGRRSGSIRNRTATITGVVAIEGASVTHSTNAILGAGIAGLAAAKAARDMGKPATVYEARDRAGGLLDNFTIDGFRFDTAVHLSFATEPEVREVFDRTPFITHKPEATNWDHGYWLKHPAQTNMFPLPWEEKVELILGLAENTDGEIRNYRDWLIQQYGLPIAERWPLVYTEKYWTLPAEKLGTDWIGQRMRRADLREVLQGALTAETPNHYYVKEMRYPERGGYRAFIEPLIEAADVRLGHRLSRIDPISRRLEFAQGEVTTYDRLVSTLPLPTLINCIESVPDEVRRNAATLFATSLDLVSVGFKREDVPPALWFYIYDRDIKAARAYSPSWKSPDNAPPGCSSLQFEIYSSPQAPQDQTPEQLKQGIVGALGTMGLASPEDILVLDHRTVPFANVVFDLGMEERRDSIIRWLNTMDIQCAGRFGEWAYLWSNQAMMSGLKAGVSAFT